MCTSPLSRGDASPLPPPARRARGDVSCGSPCCLPCGLLPFSSPFFAIGASQGTDDHFMPLCLSSSALRSHRISKRRLCSSE